MRSADNRETGGPNECALIRRHFGNPPMPIPFYAYQYLYFHFAKLFVHNTTPTNMKTEERDLLWSLKEQVCEVAIRTMELGFNIGSAGNVSVRIPEKEELLITPSQVDYEILTPY